MQRPSASRSTKSRSSISSGRWPCSAASGEPAGGVSARSCSSTKRVSADLPAPGSPSNTRRRCPGWAISSSAGSGLTCSQVRAICSACAASLSGSSPWRRSQSRGSGMGGRLRRACGGTNTSARRMVMSGSAAPGRAKVARSIADHFACARWRYSARSIPVRAVVAAPALRAATIASICLWRCSTT